MCTDERCNHPWTCSCGDCKPTTLILNAAELPADDADGKIVVEASDLGLPPGTWPSYVDVRYEDDTRFYYRHKAVRDGEGDVVAMMYVDRKARELHILND